MRTEALEAAGQLALCRTTGPIGPLRPSIIAAPFWSGAHSTEPAPNANGLAFGFTAYSLIKILRGRFREVNWFVYLLTALFLLRFFFLS